MGPAEDVHWASPGQSRELSARSHPRFTALVRRLYNGSKLIRNIHADAEQAALKALLILQMQWSKTAVGPLSPPKCPAHLSKGSAGPAGAVQGPKCPDWGEPLDLPAPASLQTLQTLPALTRPWRRPGWPFWPEDLRSVGGLEPGGRGAGRGTGHHRPSLQARRMAS